MRLLAATLAALSSVQCAPPSPVPLALGVHHLVDAALLASTDNTYFALGALSKDTDNPLVVPEYPWEAALHFYTSLVALNASSWALYYGCSDATLFFFPISVCVATSRDGRAWTKPLLSIHPYTANGTAPPVPTNIVFITEPNTFALHAFADPRSGAIVLAYESQTDGQRYVRAATSLDGLTFSPAAADPSSPPAIPYGGFADTAVSVTYDARAGAYAAFGRHDQGVPNSTARCAGANAVFRWVARSAKPCGGGGGCSPTDASNWSTPELVAALAPGAGGDFADCLDNYNPAALAPIPDAGTGALHIALPSVMRHMPLADSGAPDERAGANDGWMDIRLAVSRDGGANFTFPTRDAFLRRGVGARDAASGLYNASGSEPDAGFVFATNGGVLDVDASAPYVHLLYWGSQTTHAGGGAYLARYVAGARTGVYRARLRREGWAGLASLPAAPAGAGAARTVALRLPQGQPALFLRFNAAVDAAGELSVALLGEAGGALPGFGHGECAPLTGNGLRQTLVCAGAGQGGDLGALAARGAPVVLDIQLTHSTLFAWELAAQ